MSNLLKDCKVGAPALCYLLYSCSDQMWPENTPCTTSSITGRQIESIPLIFRLPPFTPTGGYRGPVSSSAWPDMDPYCRRPRGVLTLHLLWSHVWGPPSAKTRESAERVEGWCGYIGCGRGWCQCHASSMLALNLVGPEPVLWVISTCWIRVVLAVRRSALLLDVQGRCSPMLSGGKGLAPACYPGAELPRARMLRLTVQMCSFNSLGQLLRQYLENRSLTASCHTIVHWTGRPGTGRLYMYLSSSLSRRDKRAKPHCLLCQPWKV